MEANQILQSSLLDIIFAGRNKEYGAYQLRKTYNKRMYLAFTGVITIILLFFFARIVAHNYDNTTAAMIPVVDSNIVTALPDKEPPPQLPPPPVAIKAPPIASQKYSTIEIVREVPEPPPDMDQINNARIDIKTTAGISPGDIIAPPISEQGTQVVYQGPTKSDTKDSTFTRVEVDATFPGGANAWQRYISRAINAAMDEFSDADYGTCTVKFIVDKHGNVSDVQATTMKESKLAEVAVNAIRKGPKWIPALQNGTYVNAYRIQPVTLLNPNR